MANQKELESAPNWRATFLFREHPICLMTNYFGAYYMEMPDAGELDGIKFSQIYIYNYAILMAHLLDGTMKFVSGKLPLEIDDEVKKLADTVVGMKYEDVVALRSYLEQRYGILPGWLEALVWSKQGWVPPWECNREDWYNCREHNHRDRNTSKLYENFVGQFAGPCG
jgi:hypothetical protein